LDVEDFVRGEIEQAFETADQMAAILRRPIRRVPALRGRTVVNLFCEASTRTRVSFELAAKMLGADVVNVSASGSSVEKGETLLDTVHTLRALGADLLVVRHPHSGAPHTVAEHVDLPVVNAGDGTHAHPTQALLDAYTIRQQFGSCDGKKVVIIGDIAHSRVARSNAWCLGTLGADIVLCGPPNLLPSMLLGQGDGREGPWRARVELDVERAIEGAHVVMPLRVQLERQEGNRLASLREYARDYALTSSRLRRASSDAIVLHPGPMNEGVEIDPDVAHGAQSLVNDQVSNGVAVRMAVLYLLLAAAAGARLSTGEEDRALGGSRRASDGAALAAGRSSQ
jgi:aspartate carbamoyltransferase catalytic subunit